MINSVLKAIDILQVFSPSEPRLMLAEISRRLDIPRSTAQNLLKTMASRGFIERVDEGCYSLGPTIISLTQAVRVNVELRDRAAPLLRDLAGTLRESVYLTSLDGDFILYIYALESPQRLLARTAVGDKVHLHCTSTGKAVLSCFSMEEVVALVDRTGLPKFTDTTITTLDTLLSELKEIREQGYALDRSEHEVGNFCVGAPILNERAAVIGSCSVSGTDPEIIGNRLTDLSARIMYTAQEISRRMGYVPNHPRQIIMPTGANKE